MPGDGAFRYNASKTYNQADAFKAKAININVQMTEDEDGTGSQIAMACLLSVREPRC